MGSTVILVPSCFQYKMCNLSRNALVERERLSGAMCQCLTDRNQYTLLVVYPNIIGGCNSTSSIFTV